MNEKDIISKHLLKRITLDMARILLHLDVDNVELLETQSQRVEERRADMVVKASGAEGEFLLHLEIQNDNQALMPWRMLRYRADAVLQYPGMPVRQYLLYIGREPLTMADGILETGLDYRFHIVDMHSVDCRTLLEQDTPDALVMAILCDFQNKPAREVVRYILSRLYALSGDNASDFRDYLLMLEVLSTNRNLQTVLQEEAAMLSQVRYSDLPSYHLGMQQGVQQGVQQGESDMMLSLLECKFGALAAETRRKVQSADAVTLLAWSRRVLTADSIDDVLH